MHAAAVRTCLCLTLLLLAGCGEEDAAAHGPDLFPVGEPIGAAVSATLGQEGGVLGFDDGSIEIVVPEGAVDGPVEFRIEEITRTAVHGSGRAFRLSPHGRSFAVPVAVRFGLTERDRALPSPESLVPAYQDESGAFLAVRDVEIDLEAGTLTAWTTHFSDWTYFEAFSLEAQQDRVKVGESVDLVVNSCLYEDVEFGPHVIAALTRTCRPLTLSALVQDASVNGVVGGSAELGTVTKSGSTLTYTAPAVAPDDNPVAISAAIDILGRPSKLLVLANVTVIDPGTYTGTASKEETSGHGLHADVTFTANDDFGEIIAYVPSGSVTVTMPGCTVSPSSATIEPDDGYLEIDFSYSPPQYYGGGITFWPATVTCTGADPVVYDVGGAWWRADPTPASEDGCVLAGQVEYWSWSFAR